MLLASTDWELLSYVTQFAVTILVLIITIFLFLSIRNVRRIKLTIKGGYTFIDNSPKIRVSYFNNSSNDFNLLSVGFILNDKKVECLDRLPGLHDGYVPCLSHDNREFKLKANDFINIMQKVGCKLDSRVKIYYFGMDTNGNFVKVRDRKLLKLLRELVKNQNAPIVIDDTPIQQVVEEPKEEDIEEQINDNQENVDLQ